MQNQIMIDLETMSTSQNAVIVSIGCVKFNFENDIQEEFYKKISIQSCLNNGMICDEGTILFWLKQSDKARLEIGINQIGINQCLIELNKFIEKEDCVWGNPASFDLGILSNSYEKCGIEKSWHYRNERDLRTLVSLFPEIKKNCEFVGEPHKPIDDCKHQIKYLKQIINKIYENKNN